MLDLALTLTELEQCHAVRGVRDHLADVVTGTVVDCYPSVYARGAV